MLRISRFFLWASLLCALFPGAAVAEARLFVPLFRCGPAEDTNLLILNAGEYEARVDLWAFTGAGDFLGQVQLWVPAHGSQTLTVADAFGLDGAIATGWLGAVSTTEELQLSYILEGETSQSFDGVAAGSAEAEVAVTDPAGQVLRITNPSGFPVQVVVRSTDASGAFLELREVSVAPFAQLEIPPASGEDGRVSKLAVTANAEVITSIDEIHRSSEQTLGFAADQQQFELVIESEQAIGAYQVTLDFDPAVVQLSTTDIQGGSSSGFDTKPLVVGIDNAAGKLTVGSFQVGSGPRGRVSVAVIRVHAAGAIPRFGINVDEVTDLIGNSLTQKALSVGLIRSR